jgi:hypothetical protein
MEVRAPPHYYYYYHHHHVPCFKEILWKYLTVLRHSKMFFVLKFELILIIGSRRAPEKYIAGAALDRAGLDNVGSSPSHNPLGLHGLLQG